MAPVKLGYADGTGRVNSKHLNFYAQRAPFLGAVTPEPLYLDKGLREIPTQLGIDTSDKLEGLKKLTDLLHESNTQAIAHLNHPGRMANPNIPGNYFWSASAIACENGGTTPVAMTREMMQEVIKLFVDRSQKAVSAGFDVIEIQFGHGYLLAQFLSPATNIRTDEYGGSEENRWRFPLEVAAAVQKAVKVPLIARLSGDEMIRNGFHVDEMKRFALQLQTIGFDAVHVTAGSACTTPPWFFQHMFIQKGKTWDLGLAIQSVLHIPVIFVGRINSKSDIQSLKSKGARFLALGRTLVSDPDFVGKYLHKISGTVRPCLACAEGCLGGVKQGKGLGCVVNPTVNTGLAMPERTLHKKRLAVVGGGLAGMQMAITLTERGHEVELFEKNMLGGQFNLAWLPPNKESLRELVDYYIAELERFKIKVIYEEADEKTITKGSYHEVIMATGALPAVPPIAGLKTYYWTEFLTDDQLPHDSKVLVIGGGLIGVEIASKLVDARNQVVVVEMMKEMARGMEMIEKKMTLAKLEKHQVEFHLGYMVLQIEGNKATIVSDQEQKTIDHIDKIVVATGMKSYLPFQPENIQVHLIGDAQQPANAQRAIHDAYALATSI